MTILSQDNLQTDKSMGLAPAIGRPLAVDLDGTLIHTDILYESVLRLLKNKPLVALAIPFWLLSGKVALKERLVSHTTIDITSLPFNFELIEWLRREKSSGRQLILCTASHQSIARDISLHLGLFDEVIASDDNMNISGEIKASALVKRYGEGGFDYVGNSIVDLAVWKQSKKGIVVNGSKNLINKARMETEIAHVIPKEKGAWKSWGRALRLHQWVKNLLIFIPALAAHLFLSEAIFSKLFLAFLAFGLCASSVYITNDLMDLDSDRQHPRKRNRPFASGRIPIWQGVLLSPILIAVSFIIAQHVGKEFLLWMLVYAILTFIYSWALKRMVLVDCLALAILYTLRIISGAAAVSVPLSFWLLAFSIFLFLSLAFIKRYAELQMLVDDAAKKMPGRGYYTTDAPLIQQLGVSSGYLSTLVLALYLNSDNVTNLYHAPEIIWGAIPLMVLWLSWMWLKAQRGLMHDDPIIFAIKDKFSISIGAAFVMIFIVATFW